ncbi:hypothetical protein [Lactiplantibacillus plantarum]
MAMMSDELRWHITIIREIDGLEVQTEFDTPFELKHLLKTMSDYIGDDKPKMVSIKVIGDGADD